MRIVVLVGLPGSGKSTYLEQLGAGGLSSDRIRQLLADDESDQSIHDRVFETLRYLLRQRLALARPVTYIDATNLTPQERSPYIGIGAAYGCEVEALFLDTPLAVCRERNERRARVVPAEALAKMQERLVAPTTEEGFARVARVSHLASAWNAALKTGTGDAPARVRCGKMVDRALPAVPQNWMARAPIRAFRVAAKWCRWLTACARGSGPAACADRRSARCRDERSACRERCRTDRPHSGWCGTRPRES